MYISLSDSIKLRYCGFNLFYGYFWASAV